MNGDNVSDYFDNSQIDEIRTACLTAGIASSDLDFVAANSLEYRRDSGFRLKKAGQVTLMHHDDTTKQKKYLITDGNHHMQIILSDIASGCFNTTFRDMTGRIL